jgi:hypothetical protein
VSKADIDPRYLIRSHYLLPIRRTSIATFDEGRADFERAWQVFLANRTEADLQAWRHERDWTVRKYALSDAGEHLEPPSHGPGKPARRFRKTGRMKC